MNKQAIDYTQHPGTYIYATRSSIGNWTQSYPHACTHISSQNSSLAKLSSETFHTCGTRLFSPAAIHLAASIRRNPNCGIESPAPPP